MTDAQKIADLEAALDLSVERYHRKFDSYGPYWSMFGAFVAMLRCMDDRGSPSPGCENVLPQIVARCKKLIDEYMATIDYDEILERNSLREKNFTPAAYALIESLLAEYKEESAARMRPKTIHGHDIM